MKDNPLDWNTWINVGTWRVVPCVTELGVYRDVALEDGFLFIIQFIEEDRMWNIERRRNGEAIDSVSRTTMLPDYPVIEELSTLSQVMERDRGRVFVWVCH
jgi:hypothetical protein